MDLICIDDDSSTRTALKWSNADHMRNHNTTDTPKVQVKKKDGSVEWKDRPDKGQLDGHVPEPNTTADPNHRRKILTGDLLLLATAKGDAKLTMTKMDVTRLGKNYGYMIQSLPRHPKEQYVSLARAVLEHHFDCHGDCGPWCKRKSMSAAQLAASKRFYRCKQKDSKLYHKLNEILSRFVSYERLEEVAHGMDTNVNESINNTVSYFAPKNRVYCSSRSLQNRVAISIGIISLGLDGYFRRLLKALGIAIPESIQKFLSDKQKNRMRRLLKRRETESKRKRKAGKFAKLKEEEEKAIRARDKRDGTYKTGGNLDPEGFDGGSKGKRKSSGRPTCPICKQKGHKTTKSKQCFGNPANPNYNPSLLLPQSVPSSNVAVAPQTKQEEHDDQQWQIAQQEDVDNMDQLPFTDDVEPDFTIVGHGAMTKLVALSPME